MSNPQNPYQPQQPRQIPAGWYPDPSGTAAHRWWDGTQWTQHVSGTPPYAGVQQGPQAGQQAYGQQAYAQQAYAQQAYAPQRQPIQQGPVSVRTPTVFMWIVSALPVLSAIVYLIFPVSGIIENSMRSAMQGDGPTLSGGYFALEAFGVVLYAALVVLAAFDWRALSRGGVQRPFHWAWAFLNAGVYVIGASIVTRRRTGSTLTPIWIWIAATLITFIVGIWQLVAVISFIAQLAHGYATT